MVTDRVELDDQIAKTFRAGSRWLQLAIEDTLDEGLPRAYTTDLYKTKCGTLSEHVYESYFGDGSSVYVEVA